jgi:hypothetical protein
MADAMFEDWEAEDFEANASSPLNESITALQQSKDHELTVSIAADHDNEVSLQQRDKQTASTGKRKKIDYTDFDGLDDEDDDYSNRNIKPGQPAAAQATAATITDDSKKRRKVAGTSSNDTRQVAASVNGSSVCQHPSYWAGLCVQCGAPKPEADSLDPLQTGAYHASQALQQSSANSRPGKPLAAATHIKHLHAKGHLEVSAQEAERLRQLEVSRLLSNRKLVLILDLDHTLLNSVRMIDVSHDVLQAPL